MKSAYAAVFLVFAILALLLPPSAAAQVQPVQVVHNPLRYAPASLTTPGSPPFVPSEIRRAYDFLPLYSRGINGTGTRIAIIDAYGSSSLSSDLASFDSLTGLPSATVNSFFPDGPPARLPHGSSWPLETSLDIEWAHAIAPEATIDLVVAPDASLSHIYDAISFVANSLTSETVLSMSFGLSESQYPTTGSGTIASTHQQFVTMTSHGTTPFASSGDSGASSCCNIQYPASDPLVVAVGGTTLSLNSTANYASEETWSGSTAGSSIVFPKPVYQQGLGDNMRDNVDVSYDADPNTGFLVVRGGVEYTVGGTSAGSPQWAALIDLASQANATRFGPVLPQLYKSTAYHDVTTGSDTFFLASAGWDYPTGLGSPDANAIVNSLEPRMGDVAVTGIAASRSFAYSGVSSNPISLNVTVANIGSPAETFLLTVKANSTVVGNLTVTIAGGASSVAVFDWNPSPLTRGNYTLSAHASPVLGEIDLVNNDLASSTLFQVRMAGDTDADCTVNVLDLVTVGGVFGTTTSSSLWNPNADLNNDGRINIFDLTAVGSNFGSHC